MSSADSVDQLNLNQCEGKSCKGLLGTGRINVRRSIESYISNLNVLEGDLVRLQETGAVYFIQGGKKQLVSSFVYNQKFLGSPVKNVLSIQLAELPEGTYAAPLEGTLVKVENNPTVYMIKNGTKQPILTKVFSQRKLKFTDIKVVSFSELNSWVQGSFLPPEEGVIVKNALGRSLFWVLGETLRPINRQFIVDKGIGNFGQLVLSDKDINGFSKGEKLY
jgi:hypothetical protein